MVTQSMMRTHEGVFLNKSFWRKKNRFDLIKCLKYIKLQILLLACAPNSELPSNTEYHWLDAVLDFKKARIRIQSDLTDPDQLTIGSDSDRIQIVYKQNTGYQNIGQYNQINAFC